MAQPAVRFAVPHARRLCRSLLDAMNDAVMILDPRSSRIVDANESALKIYGYSKEEFIGKELKELTHETVDYSRLVRPRQRIERTDFNKAGGKIDFLVSLSKIDYWGRKAILSINTDIGERKRIETLAISGEKRLRLLIQGISEIVALVDAGGLVLFISPQVERVLGLKVQEVIGRSIFDFVHGDDQERVTAEYSKTVQEPGEGVPTVARFRNKKGQWVPFEIIANNQLQDTEIAGVIFTARDLRFRIEAEQTIRQANAEFDKHVEERTLELAKANAALRIENQQRRYAEIQLQRSLSLHHATLESTADGILVISNDGFVSGYNQKLTDMWHIPRISISGRRGVDLLLSVVPQVEDSQIFLDGIDALKAKPDSVGFDTILLKDGRIFERYTQPQRVEEQIVGRVWSFRDITHARRLEEELRQSQKMEAVGRLAGGVAHDFNNLLMLISGYADQLLQDPDLLEKHRICCEQLVDATKRAATLTRQLLAFSRKHPVTPHVVDMKSLISDMGKMLERLLSDRIQLVINLRGDDLPIFADPSQVELLVMNLAINARDAMPEGGLLSITTSNETVDEAKGHGSAVSSNYVVLEVSDTGVGMSPEVKDRIFEPFFTTKGVGKGTGLGLSTAYGIVEQANGHITVESEPDNGTTFRVYFPRATAAVPEKVVTTKTPPAPGHETLLLAEDEPGIRAMTRVYLENLGYKVLDAPNGSEALRISREYGQAIDLLLTDIVMPGMRGDDLARTIQKERPGIAVLFISGYADIEELGVRIPIIEKPFTFPELGKRVRSSLDDDRSTEPDKFAQLQQPAC
jgi:two-component system, cell cycle sensor histidine kinase and response regulator CckA